MAESATSPDVLALHRQCSEDVCGTGMIAAELTAGADAA
jgi:hypothetical protein